MISLFFSSRGPGKSWSFTRASRPRAGNSYWDAPGSWAPLRHWTATSRRSPTWVAWRMEFLAWSFFFNMEYLNIFKYIWIKGIFMGCINGIMNSFIFVWDMNGMYKWDSHGKLTSNIIKNHHLDSGVLWLAKTINNMGSRHDQMEYFYWERLG